MMPMLKVHAVMLIGEMVALGYDSAFGVFVHVILLTACFLHLGFTSAILSWAMSG